MDIKTDVAVLGVLAVCCASMLILFRLRLNPHTHYMDNIFRHILRSQHEEQDCHTSTIVAALQA